MPNLYPSHSAGDILPAADWQAAMNLSEASFFDIGPLILSGLVPSAGTGLSVNVTGGNALFSADVVFAGFVISSLADNTTNHLYALQDGTNTSNTTGTAPANSVKLGQCTTAGGIVTAVGTSHGAGRQAKVRTENLVLGGGAGHPRSANLATWAAAAADGVEVYGTLPTGALPSDTAKTDLANVFTVAPQTLKLTDAGTTTQPDMLVIAHRSSGTVAAGFGSTLRFQSDNGSGTLTTFGLIQSQVSTPTNGTEDGALQLSIIHSGTVVEVMRVRGVGMAPSGGFGGEMLVSGDFKHAGTKLGFFGATTAAQIAGSTDVLAGLVTHGLRAASSNPPLNLGSGAVTAGAVTMSGLTTTTGGIANPGHYVGTGGAAPTAAAGANAGGSPPAPFVYSDSTDQRGYVSTGTGTLPTAGSQVVVTFHTPYANPPYVMITAHNAAAAALVPYLVDTQTTTFTIGLALPPAASQGNMTYDFDYLVIG